MGGAHISKDPEVHEMYKKTHGNYDPGEQKQRNYQWKFDPADHCYGYGEKKVLNGAAMALHNERLNEEFPKTVIVKKPLKITKQQQMTCQALVRIQDKDKLTEEPILYMVLKMFKEKIHGMLQDVFMESLKLHKLYQIMIQVNQSSQTAEML